MALELIKEHARPVAGIQGRIATLLLDPAQLKELNLGNIPFTARGSKSLFAVHLGSDNRILGCMELPSDDSDYDDGKHVNPNRRSVRAARILGLLS